MSHASELLCKCRHISSSSSSCHGLKCLTTFIYQLNPVLDLTRKDLHARRMLGLLTLPQIHAVRGARFARGRHLELGKALGVFHDDAGGLLGAIEFTIHGTRGVFLQARRLGGLQEGRRQAKRWIPCKSILITPSTEVSATAKDRKKSNPATG